LKRIRAEAGAAGLVFSRLAPNRDRDLGWLYRRAARNDTFDVISGADRVTWGRVRSAVLRMAARVGISSQGWEKAFDH
jgi:hypothetical protein